MDVPDLSFSEAQFDDVVQYIQVLDVHKAEVIQIGKNLERVVFDAIVCHLLKNNLLSHKQSGFRPEHSTQDVLLHVTDSWLKAI